MVKPLPQSQPLPDFASSHTPSSWSLSSLLVSAALLTPEAWTCIEQALMALLADNKLHLPIDVDTLLSKVCIFCMLQAAGHSEDMSALERLPLMVFVAVQCSSACHQSNFYAPAILTIHLPPWQVSQSHTQAVAGLDSALLCVMLEDMLRSMRVRSVVTLKRMRGVQAEGEESEDSESEEEQAQRKSIKDRSKLSSMVVKQVNRRHILGVFQKR